MSPDKRRHRGAHPEDKQLFDESKVGLLRAATMELSWLVGRGYSMNSSLKLVGDRHNLTDRQRVAVSRASCSDEQRQKRKASLIPVESMRGRRLAIDGFNLIITLEAALAGGILIYGRDHCLRDLSSVHGSYRSVAETEKAIRLIGEAISSEAAESAIWFLDRPVSNSGRLAQMIRDIASERALKWEVELVNNPDAAIINAGAIAITSDSIILDKSTRWINLARHIIKRFLPEAWVVDLSD